MKGSTHIIVAAIGALAAVTGAFFTAQAAAGNRVNEVDTKVQVLQERQELQYRELSNSFDRVEKKLDILLQQ